MKLIKLFLFLWLQFNVSFSQELDHELEIRELDNLNITQNNDTIKENISNNSTVNDEKGIKINQVSWENVLKGLSNLFNEINRLFNKLWESIRNYISGNESSNNKQDLSNNNTTDLNKEIANRTLWSMTIPEFKINLPEFLTKDSKINNKKVISDRMVNSQEKTDLLKINQSTSEEEILSGILLSCTFFALFIVCWLLAFIKDKTDWVSILKRPHVIFLQQIPNKDLLESDGKYEKIILFNGILFPYANFYLIPPIRMTIGHLRLLTIIIQTIFFPLTITHFFTSRFNISHFHFEFFNNKLKLYYDSIRKDGFILNYYYLSNQDQFKYNKDEENKLNKNIYSEKSFLKSIYDENIILLSIIRYLSKKENSNKLPTPEEVKEWCDGFWFRVNKLDKEKYKELQPRIACLIVLRKVVYNEYLSQDYLRRLKMQIIGANYQSEYVRDWIKSNLIENNPKLDLPFNWTPRRPTGSIKITLHDSSILELISDYKKRIGIHSENQVKLFLDVASGQIQNLECYLWLIDELQTICIHPTILCDSFKGFDALEWLGPFGLIPFEKMTSFPVNDTVNGIMTLILGKRKVINNSTNSLKLHERDSTLGSLFLSSKTGEELVTQDTMIEPIRFTVTSDRDDISSLNYLIKSLMPKSRLRTSSSNISKFSTEASNSWDSNLNLTTLPKSVLNEGTNDVFWGDKLKLRTRNNDGEYDIESNSTCFWEFDMPVPYTATTVIINDVLTYIWLNYDSKLLCVQRKDVSIEKMGDYKSIKTTRDQKSEVEDLKESISLSKLKSFDDNIFIESYNNTPNSDSCIEIININSILNEPSNNFVEKKMNSNEEITTATRGRMNINELQDNETNKNNFNKWLPFDKSLSSLFGVLTNDNINKLHPVYAVPGILGGAFCTRGYFIGSIISIHLIKDSLEDVVEEYARGVEAQLLIAFEGGQSLKISTFSLGMANSIKESLELIINSLEESVMLPIRHSLSRIATENKDSTQKKIPNNLVGALFSVGVSPPDIIARCDQIIEYEKTTFKENFIKSFSRFNPIIGRLQWSSSSPRVYRWLSYTTSTSISHFLIFYLLTSIPRINKVGNGLLVGWVAYCILNISKMLFDNAMSCNTVLQVLSVKQQAAYSYFRLWIIWLTASFCLLMTILLPILTILQSNKPGNNIEASSGFILNDINYSISTWIAGFLVTFLSLFLQPLTLSLLYTSMLLLSRITGTFDGIVAFFKYFNNMEVLKNGLMPIRPYRIIKQMKLN